MQGNTCCNYTNHNIVHMCLALVFTAAFPSQALFLPTSGFFFFAARFWGGGAGITSISTSVFISKQCFLLFGSSKD